MFATTTFFFKIKRIRKKVEIILFTIVNKEKEIHETFHILIESVSPQI